MLLPSRPPLSNLSKIRELVISTKRFPSLPLVSRNVRDLQTLIKRTGSFYSDKRPVAADMLSEGKIVRSSCLYNFFFKRPMVSIFIHVEGEPFGADLKVKLSPFSFFFFFFFLYQKMF